MIKSLLSEYGVGWTANRSLYTAKLKIMTNFSCTERLFEKKVSVKRVDIFDFELDTIKDFLSTLSKEKQQSIIAVADKATNGIINGFSSVELDYGYPINWHLNPLTGYESRKDLKWFKLPDFDKKIGDIKVIWEASRLTHFLYFGRAYLITNDKKYYTAFSNQLEDWLKSNPYSYGSNYKCGQESTLRMINALIAYSVFREFGLITKKDKKHICEIVEGSYKKVLSNFFYAHKCIKNNHTFTEILGMIIGAWCSEDNARIRKAYKLMDQEIVNQFFPDGGFNQYSFNYHRFTLQILEALFKISEKTGIQITETERIKKSILLLYHVQAENGDVPNYGSNDGALIFPLSTCGYRDFRPVLNTMYGLISGKKLYEKGPYDEELLWFFGSADLPVEKITPKSIAFDYTGFYVLRHEKGFLMTCLQDYGSRPAHMDQLHIDLWHKGINILCDSGTYSYASELGKELSSTIGHNTVKIPSIEQMNKRGAFLVTDWTKREQFTHSEFEFKGKVSSQNGYSHSRKVIRLQNGYLIKDKVTGESEVCEFVFNTPCDVRVNENGFILLRNNHKIASIDIEGDIDITESFRSLYYMRKEKINRVRVIQSMQNGICHAKYEISLY
ncbi:heparinase II/III family protein [Proteinivorax hydrogeniformans]|uniref:Heparinase II/III family protein n=1 Tax=Proteinivorax hydrogeniformans TaxID=1826727 RepID=A0AAU8HWW7_9FIRM